MTADNIPREGPYHSTILAGSRDVGACTLRIRGGRDLGPL